MTFNKGTCNIIDLYHGNTVEDWDNLLPGIEAIIYKATDGLTWYDANCQNVKQQAVDHGLMWGFYHYSQNDDGTLQAEHFLSKAKPSETDLVGIDVEEKSTHIHYDDLCAFVEKIHAELGRYPVVYGSTGGYLKTVTSGHAAGDTILTQCPLWIARYGAYPEPDDLPDPWHFWTLWQYAVQNKVNDVPPMITTPGMPSARLDCIDSGMFDTFNVTDKPLKDFWPNI